MKEQTTVIDLMDLCTEELADLGVDISIIAPNGQDTGIVINMKGTDSEAYDEEDKAIKRYNLAQAKSKKDYLAGTDPDEIKTANLRRLKSCFNHWKQKTGVDDNDNPIYKDTIRIGGQELASNRKNFTELMARRGFFWIRSQVEEGMDKVSNFLPKARTTSAPQLVSGSNMIPPEKTE